MYADLTRVRQVLFNVLGNAAKFTEHGLITLRVITEEVEVPTALVSPELSMSPIVTFQISDTGPGMSEEQQQQIFKEFVQVDEALAKKYGGSGLGLAISYRLCQLMGGNIYVTSALGQGSTFTIDLPLQVSTLTDATRGSR